MAREYPDTRAELAMGSASIHTAGIENFGLSGKSFRQ